jgi:type I restriction enzyme S subunit
MLFNFGKGVATHDGFGRWAINEDTILKTNIFLPDLETQNIAVRYLERKTKNIDTLLEKLQNKIDLLNEQRTSMINDFVTKGLDPNVEMKDSGIEWIGEIPKHWTLKKITHVTNMIGSGTTPKSDNKDYYENGDINWLVTGDLNDDYIVQTSNKITQKALNDLSSLKIYPVNSLLLAMYGATLGKLGILKTESTVNQATCVLNFDESNSVDFWFYVFLGNRNYVESLGFGGGQPNISQEVVKGLRFPSPPTYEEQVDIVKMIKENLGNHDNIIKRENNRINLLKKYRQSLVSSVVTGKVQVTKDMV